MARILYTESNQPATPEAHNIGGWFRTDRMLSDVGNSERAIGWRVTFENSVGGQVGNLFKTRKAARTFVSNIVDRAPHAMTEMQGRTFAA